MLDSCKKFGISSSKNSVEDSIELVSALLRKGKTDEIGDFVIKSQTKQISDAETQDPPEYWTKISNYANTQHNGMCLVVSVLHESTGVDYFKSDLLLSDDDFNNCYFHKRLANCLVKERSVLYLTVGNLTIRGRERVISVVRDCKKLLDDRCWIILISACELSAHLKPLIDLSLSYKVERLRSKRQASIEASTLMNKILPKKTKLNSEGGSEVVDSGVNHLQADVEELKKVLNAKEKYIQTLIVQNESTFDEKKALSSNCENLEKLNSDLKDVVAREKKKVSELQDAVANEGNKVSELLDAVANEKNKVSELQDAVANERNKVSELLDSVANEKNKVSELLDAVANEKNKVSELQDAVDNEKSKVSKLQNAVACEKKKVSELQDTHCNKTVNMNSKPTTSVYLQTDRQAQHKQYTSVNKMSLSNQTRSSIKKNILEIEKQFPDASPAEILHRVLDKNLKYTVQFEVCGENNTGFQCALRVLNEEFCDFNFINDVWKGNGRSKTKAKMSAFSLLLDSIKKMNV